MASARKGRSYRSAARRSPQLTKALRRLGRRVQQLRHEAELSQEEAASRAGLDAKHLQTIEAGRTNPTVATLVGLARSLGVTLSELFEGV